MKIKNHSTANLRRLPLLGLLAAFPTVEFLPLLTPAVVVLAIHATAPEAQALPIDRAVGRAVPAIHGKRAARFPAAAVVDVMPCRTVRFLSLMAATVITVSDRGSITLTCTWAAPFTLISM